MLVPAKRSFFVIRIASLIGIGGDATWAIVAPEFVVITIFTHWPSFNSDTYSLKLMMQ